VGSRVFFEHCRSTLATMHRGYLYFTKYILQGD
jgi:hypothetical protein